MVFIMHASGNKGREKISKIITKKLLYKKNTAHNFFFLLQPFVHNRFDQCLLKQISPYSYIAYKKYAILQFS